MPITSISFNSAIRALAAAAFAVALAGCPGGGNPTKPDTRPAFAVTTTSPANGATAVGLNSAISVTFTREPDVAFVSQAGFAITPATDGAFALSGTTVTFTPSAALQASTAYSVTVSGSMRDQGGDALPHAVAFTFTTGTGADKTPPAAVYDLAVGTVTPTSVSLKWTATGDDGKTGTAASYDLRYASGSHCPMTAASYAEGTKVTGLGTPKAAGTAESVTVPGLTAKVTYCFGIKVSDEVPNTSDLSNVVSATPPDATAPAAAALSAGTPTGSSIQLKWTAVGDDGATGTAASYELRYATGAGCPLTQATFTAGTKVTLPAPQAAGANESATVSGLLEKTAYCFLLKVSDAAGNASYSASFTTSTADVTAPAAPALSLGTATGASLQIKWTAVGDDGAVGTAASYELRYATGAGCPLSQDTFASGTQATTSAPQASGASEAATVSGLTSHVAYCFMLKVSDAAGNSSYSASLPGATLDVLAPAAPTLAVGTRTGTSVQLTWTAVGDDGSTGTAASYDLRYATGGGCPLTANNFGAATTFAIPAPQAAGASESATVTSLSQKTAYCFMLKVSDAATPVVNSALSSSVSATTLDATPPAKITDLAAQGLSGKAHLTWTSTGDDGFVGTAASNTLYVLQAAQCPADPSTWAGLGGTTTALGVRAAGGSPDSQDVNGLLFSKHYCFSIQAADAAGNPSAFSNVAEADTLSADPNPPDTISIAAPVTGEVASASATLHWTAPANDAGNVSSGKVTSYDVRYLVVSGPSDCDAKQASDFAGATAVVSQPTPTAQPGQTETVNVSLQAGDKDKPVCAAATATDGANNTSAVSNWRYLRDNTAPAAVADLATDTAGFKSVVLKFTAVGDDGLLGVAASYTMGVATGACPAPETFDFASATPVTPPGLPQANPNTELVTVPGLDYSTTYCFGMKVFDEVGNVSPNAVLQFTTPTPDPSAQIDTVRSLVLSDLNSPVTFTKPIYGAIVTYLKDSVGGAAQGTADGRGFVVQAGTPSAAGSAIFVAMNYTTLGGITVGDKVDIDVTQGARLGCSAQSCATAGNGMAAVINATVAKRASAQPLPKITDMSSASATAWGLTPAIVNPWLLEHQLISVTGTLDFVNQFAGGFWKAQFTTAGVAALNAKLLVRVPDAIVSQLALARGMKFNLVGTPAWRTDDEVDASAWQAAEMQPSPNILTLSPADGAVNVPVATPSLSITFNTPMDGSTLTAQTTNGACAGTVLLSSDGFVNCIGLGSALPSMSGDNLTATYGIPAGGLAASTRYKVRLQGTAKSLSGFTVTSGSLGGTASISTPNGFVTSSAAPACTDSQVVISQVYTAGGNSGSFWKNDYVELHNRGSSVKDINGWSIQYHNSGTTNNFTVSAIPAATPVIPAGGYTLIKMGAGATGTPIADLPTPLVVPSTTSDMAFSAGKVALVSNTTALAGGSCPAPGTSPVVDFVTWGTVTGTGCPLSTSALTLTGGNAFAFYRSLDGCHDSRTNQLDFYSAIAGPRTSNTAGPTCSCSGGGSTNVTNSGLAAEMDFCVLQFPTTLDLAAGASATVFGRVFESGITEPAGANASMKMEVGYGYSGSDPFTQWTFAPAAYNAACTSDQGTPPCGNNDEYQGPLKAPASIGSYSYGVRFTLDDGATWTYCDATGNGSSVSTSSFSTADLGALTVH